MNAHDQHRLERAGVRLQEIRSWRNALEVPIEDWKFTAPNGARTDVRLGQGWPSVGLPVRLEATATVPPEMDGKPVELDLWVGGEALVTISNGVSGGLNPYHRTFRISDSARAGETFTIEVEAVPKGTFGTHNPSPSIARAHLVVPETEVRALDRDLSMIEEACQQLGDHEVVPLLLDVFDAALAELGPDWPTATQTSLARYVKGRSAPPFSGWGGRDAVDVFSPAHSLWSLPEIARPLEPLPDPAREAVRRARSAIASGLEKIRRDYPPIGRLAMTGHAHIDLAWLWPAAETRRKCRRTFSSVLDLMDRYEDFTFNQSSAQAYRWVEEDDPELFERIRQRVREGRWEPVGGSWTESDCQVTGGEAFVRQLLYGQQYFREKLGVHCPVAWLPDVFGFSPAIPQLLRGAGIGGFFTIKIYWSETNEFPYDLFEWEGLDGSTVVAHMFNNPGSGYNGNIRPLDTLGTWRNFKSKRLHGESLFSFGYGDGGGGPTERMLENYQRIREFPALPRLRMARVDEFYGSLPKEGLPKWYGELYLELHRGTLTTQGRTKMLNRTAEHRLLEAEAFSAIAGLHGFPSEQEKLAEAWKVLLLNQFHDILPGSSIAEVYEDNHRMVGGVVETATDVRDRALGYLGNLVKVTVPETDNALLVANAHVGPRPLSVLVRDVEAPVSVTAPDGSAVPTQQTEDGLLVRDPERQVPGLGWSTFVLGESAAGTVSPSSAVSATEREGGAVLENDVLRVVIGADGTIHEAYDKQAGRQALADRGNQLWAYVDKPRAWDAWDIDEDYEDVGEEVGGVRSVRVTEDGPLRASVRVEREWHDSRIVQTYRLMASSRRLDVDTYVDWHERQVLLRALFPAAVFSREATFETMYGAYRRATHRNTPWEQARFEVSAHRFADISETGYGVALLNNGKYGHSAHDNVLGISLLRSPMYPHPLADEGEHEFTYSLLPHSGDYAEGGVTEEAFALNSPLVASVASPETGHLPLESGLVAVEGTELSIGSLKRSEDGSALVLRVYEPVGARGPVTLRFASQVKGAQRANLLEEPLEEALEVRGEEVRFDVRPFEVVTLRVEL